MKNDFDTVMNKKSDFELIVIVTQNKSKYVAEAVFAAENEINKRNLNIEDVLKLEEETKVSNKINRQTDPFNKSYLYAGIIMLSPITILTISIFKEVIFDIFILPIALVSFLPCGIIGLRLAKKAHNKAKNVDFGINHIVGVIEIIFGLLITTVGILGICLVYVITN